MKNWRGLRNHLRTRRKRMRLLLSLLVFLMILTGCGGGLRHESWPGMLLDGETIYVANLEHVQAINAATGKIYWSFPPESDKDVRPFYSTPVLADDYGPYGTLLIAGFKDQTVYALQLGESSAERPDEVWRFDGAHGQYVGSGILVEALFIIGNGDGYVYALDIEDGSLVWSYQTGDRIWATPVVVEDVVYVASLDHSIYALDVATGEEKWQMEMEGAVSATPIYADGSLWVGDFAANLYRINLDSQEVEWSYRAEDWLWATPVMHETTMYIVDVGGNLYAINTESNTVIWHKSGVIGDIVHGRPALNQEANRLYIAGYEKGEIHVIDTENGSKVNTWTQKNAGRLPGNLVSDDSRLYTLPILIPERIHAFDIYTGERIWPEVTD